MKLLTKHFGEIEINEEDIITFNEGILGFEEYKKYVIIDNPDQEVPFKWLQCIDEPDLSFVIINPFIFRSDYEFTLSDNTLEKLKIESENDIAVFTIVVVPDDITKMTANLQGPIIINTNKKLAKQIILENSNYKTKHYILEEMKLKEA